VNVAFGTPIPVNEYRLQGPLRKLVHALGGPAANLGMAIVFGIVTRVLVAQGGYVSFDYHLQPVIVYLTTIIYAIFFLNLSTFAFNLLPFPGLDGWRVVETLFRSRNPRFFFNVAANIQRIWVAGILVLLFAAFLRFPILSLAVAIFFQPASTVILGQCSTYVALTPCLP